jgi:hypothetical protein
MREEPSGECCWEGVSTPRGRLDSNGGGDAVNSVTPQLRGRRDSDDSDIALPEGSGSPLRTGTKLTYADVC